MNNLFPPELRTASVVQRWSIVRTFQPDSVSNHSFFVTFYALQVARLVNWAGPYADLSFAALLHDAEEVFISDIISPVKHAILDDGKYANYVSEQMKLRLPLVEAQLGAIHDSRWGSNIERIIKVADKVDAMIFLTIEQRMGNTVLAPLWQDARENLWQAWVDLAVEINMQSEHSIQVWDDEIWPAIQAH